MSNAIARLFGAWFVVSLAVLAELGALATVAGAAPLNLLYYGNSYTMPLPRLVSDIAVLGGYPRPISFDASVPTTSLQYHLENNTAVIGALPEGVTWDYVVLQDLSIQPTRLGNVAQHLSSSLGLFGLVEQHSPEVTAVMFQTWARSPGHSFYVGSFAAFPGGAVEMQRELHEAYRLSTAQLNEVHGAGSAVLAPAGDAWAVAGFPRSFYDFDLHHPSYGGSLLNALSLYAAIYGDTTVDDLPLTGLFVALGIGGADADLIVASVQATLNDPSSPNHGDYNSDGSVDAADYTVWRDDVGLDIGTLPNDPFAESDPSPIDDRQRVTWASRYGTRRSWRPPIATPEPGGWVLSVAAGLAGAIVRRKQGKGVALLETWCRRSARSC